MLARQDILPWLVASLGALAVLLAAGLWVAVTVSRKRPRPTSTCPNCGCSGRFKLEWENGAVLVFLVMLLAPVTGGLSFLALLIFPRKLRCPRCKVYFPPPYTPYR
jgi:phosphate/sulfate permease